MRKILFSASVLAVATVPAIAQTGEVDFSGTITASCSVVIDAPGQIGANAARTLFSTTANGGDAGEATITTTNGTFTLTVSDPTDFTSTPAPGGDNVSFDATATGSGDSTFTIGDGNTAALGRGVTTATIDLTAAKLTGTFAPGSYHATVVLTCE